jgi:uncharacterized membrane protein YccF (DUF307 family)
MVVVVVVVVDTLTLCRWAILPIGFKPVPIPPEEATSDLDRPGTTYNTVANVVWLLCFGWLIILTLMMTFVTNIITIIGTLSSGRPPRVHGKPSCLTIALTHART